MNEVLNDIEKLQLVNRVLSNVPSLKDIQSVQLYLGNMIKEKQKIVKDFEKQAPNHIQDLCNQIRGAR
tara:strand:+ start:274 stop:477 length:204 start_codon:yes stop_codon:yes gene_type:complete